MSRREVLGELPGGNPDTAHSEYLRGKLEVREHKSGSFTKRGNDVWAERSGRTYFSDGSELQGSGLDYAGPVEGFGKLSNLTSGGAKKSLKLPRGVISGLNMMIKESKGSGVGSLQVANLMQSGAQRNRGVSGGIGPLEIEMRPRTIAEGATVYPKTRGNGKKPNARGELVKKIMKERGVSLPEASKIVKSEGLYK
jgi:hypothetical protein